MIEGRASGFYDETEIAGRLAALPPAARTLFACACAERLMSAFRWFCERVGSPSYDFVREALNGAWSPGDPVRATGEREVAELVPDDDDGDLALGSAVAQNAVACVAYALGVRQTGEVQKAVWAAGNCMMPPIQWCSRDPRSRHMSRTSTRSHLSSSCWEGSMPLWMLRAAPPRPISLLARAMTGTPFLVSWQEGMRDRATDDADERIRCSHGTSLASALGLHHQCGTS